MKLNWYFFGGRGAKNKKTSMGGVWIFSGTACYWAEEYGLLYRGLCYIGVIAVIGCSWKNYYLLVHFSGLLTA